MVSWNDTTNNDSGEGDAGSSLLETTSDEPSQFTKDARPLFHLARQRLWDRLLTSLHERPTSPEMIRNAMDESVLDEEVSSVSNLLHVVVASYTVPVSVVQTILDLSGAGPSITSMATMQNHLQQTPLHITLHCIPERTDIVDCLVRAAPETVRQRDGLRLRPIDILCQKLIMMEEVIKYSHHHQHPDDDNADDDNSGMLNALWDTVHVLAHASRSTTDTERQPIVHACLVGVDVPFALTERAMKRYSIQLQQANSDGDLPLHIIARVPPPPRGEGDDEDDYEGDFFDRVVSLYPAAASHWNHQRQIPLIVAARSGRGWHSGIARLLQAHPAGIEELQLSHRLYPLVFEKLCQSRQISTVYGIIQATPELFSGF
jgi:hypothetical protein